MVGTVDNALLMNAVRQLYLQALEAGNLRQGRTYILDGNDFGAFYTEVVHDRSPPVRVHKIKFGDNQGKLTLEERTPHGDYEVVKRIKPVDFDNLIGNEDISTAVARLYNEGKLIYC